MPARITHVVDGSGSVPAPGKGPGQPVEVATWGPTKNEDPQLAAKIDSANNKDQVAFLHALHNDATHVYPENAKPPAGFSQDGSRPVGEKINMTEPDGRMSQHQIDDVNVIQAKDGMNWGYAYHTTDHHVFIQQDPSSKATFSGGAAVGPFSVGFTPPTGTRPEMLRDITQIPPGVTVQPSTAPGSQQLLPPEPRANIDSLMHDRAPATADIGSPARGTDVAQALGNPAVGSFVEISRNGAQEQELSRSGLQLGA